MVKIKRRDTFSNPQDEKDNYQRLLWQPVKVHNPPLNYPLTSHPYLANPPPTSA